MGRAAVRCATMARMVHGSSGAGGLQARENCSDKRVGGVRRGDLFQSMIFRSEDRPFEGT